VTREYIQVIVFYLRPWGTEDKHKELRVTGFRVRFKLETFGIRRRCVNHYTVNNFVAFKINCFVCHSSVLKGCHRNSNSCDCKLVTCTWLFVSLTKEVF
jgi:hypothetical protein